MGGGGQEEPHFLVHSRRVAKEFGTICSRQAT